MRQLFVPACLCVMTWSSSTASDPKVSLEQFTGLQTEKVERLATLASTTAIPDFVATTGSVAPAGDIVLPDAGDMALPQDDEVATQDPAPQAERTTIAADPIIELAIEYPASQHLLLTEAETPPMPKLRPPPRPVVHHSAEVICDSVTQAAQTHDLPAPFFIKLLFQESRFKPGAVSHAGAQGIAQFMPETANGMGLENPFDPLQAIPVSARLLRELVGQFGNLGLAAAAYNAGPKRIQDWLNKKGNLPAETQGYVKIITGRPAENWKSPETGSPAVKLPRQAPCQDAAGLLAWNGPDAIPIPSASPIRLAAIAKAKLPAGLTASTGRSASEAKIAAKGTFKTAGTVENKAAIKTAEKPRSADKPKAQDKVAVQLAARERNGKAKSQAKSQDKSKTVISAKSPNRPLRLTQR